MAKKKLFGYELKVYWEDDCTVECRYFHDYVNADSYGAQSGYDYAVVPLLQHEAQSVRGWMD